MREGRSHVGLLMAGGKGTRMGGAVEKPLVELGGKRLVEHVLNRLAAVRRLKGVVCVTSRFAPRTTEFLKRMRYEVIEAPGEGYLEDLKFAISALGPGLYATFSADVPFLVPEVVDGLLARHIGGDLSGRDYVVMVVREELVRSVGTSLRSATRYAVEGSQLFPTGVRLIRYRGGSFDAALSSPHFVTVEEPGFAVNVNTPEDLRIAEEILGSTRRGYLGPETRTDE
ncbi:MAG: NTP transferase domain-containing protein [Thaumarchaeota archaeon]|nr:NTP transferase domain-containing protein [Candidatus Calditenuaceae archaeon]